MLAKIFRNFMVFTVFFKNPESESGIRESVSILTKKSGIRKSRIRTKNVTDCQPCFKLILSQTKVDIIRQKGIKKDKYLLYWGLLSF